MAYEACLLDQRACGHHHAVLLDLGGCVHLLGLAAAAEHLVHATQENLAFGSGVFLGPLGLPLQTRY
jgi:hypothetical protein